MLDFLMKDLKILWRDRSELLIIFLMPFVLMTILGFALNGVMSGSPGVITIDVAIVEKDQHEEGIQQFNEAVSSQSIPTQAQEALMQAAQQLSPNALLKNLINEELSDIVTLTEMTEDEANQQLAEQEIDTVLLIPEDFTYDTLQNMLLGEEVTSTITIRKGEHAHFESDIFQNIMEQFTDTMTVESAVAKVSGRGDSSDVEIESFVQEETVTDRDSVSSMEYYTIGMAVMFAFFISATMASKAYTEVNQQVVDRMMLTGIHPIYFLLGKGAAVIIMAVIQINILFILSTFILQSFQPFSLSIWLTTLLVTLCYATTIGAIGSLLVALTIKYGSNSISDAFAGGFVSVLALLGGSFIPTDGFPAIFQTIGNWTPNGMALRSYMLANQGMPIDSIVPYLFSLLAIAVVIFSISIMIFPQRRSK
ncbi:ABC transporter permease [Gracilibacillus kekensis]|uniref:ABC-2 type transport system permease protein n=1 Tax=Gracilibacillus kekensis TaxID=1027249 RepID=A0A1M7L123_9BACI|nr:ABC transporter permease [Gracilibacillus kekensis]SHM71619.1 ABC-2 type transport system permease protein [Gracilibacillus kekensis]